MDKRVLACVPLIAMAIVLALVAKTWISNPVRIYALGGSDTEIEFVVTDADTGAPVSGASIEVTIWEEAALPVLCASTVGLVSAPAGQGPVCAAVALFPERPEEIYPVYKATSDDEGRTTFFKKLSMWEDVVRVRSERRVFNLNWGSLSVSAQGYSGIEKMPLPEAGHENTGYDDQNHVQRLRVRLALSRKANR
jgi:hypothetical protein